MDMLPKIPKDCKEDTWQEPLIRKGFVRRGYIAERTGLHPAIRFVYQPLLPEITDEMTDKVGSLGAGRGKESTAIVASFLVKHLKAWSIEHPVTELNIRQLGEALLNRLRTIMCQLAPSDIDPLWAAETSDFKSVDELLGESSEPLPSE